MLYQSIWYICEFNALFNRVLWNVVTVLLEYINLEQLFSFKSVLFPKLLALLANNNASYDDLQLFW